MEKKLWTVKGWFTTASMSTYVIGHGCIMYSLHDSHFKSLAFFTQNSKPESVYIFLFKEIK